MDGVRAERSAVRSLTRFDPSIFRSHNAAEVNDFVLDCHLEAKRAETSRPVWTAFRRRGSAGLEDANIDLAASEDRDRIGTMMGRRSAASRTPRISSDCS